MKKNRCTRFGLFLLSASLLLSFSACGGAAASSQANAASFYAEPGAATEEASAGFSEDITAPAPSAQRNNNTPAADYSRKIILNANAQFETLNFDDTISQLNQFVQAAGGRVKESHTNNAAKTVRSATYTFHVPAANYTSFIENISSLEHLLSLNESSDDVTRQYLDTEARIKSLTIQKERLEEFLTRAENVEDLIALQERLSNIQYEIESFTTSKMAMDELVAFSTITISVQEVKEIVEPTPENFLSKLSQAFKGGWENTLHFLQGILLFLASSLPLLLFIAILAIVLFVFLRRNTKKAAAKNAAAHLNHTSLQNQSPPMAQGNFSPNREIQPTDSDKK